MKKKVLVIGAGAAGLITVKEFYQFFEVVCMEQLSVVGGLWNYSGDVALSNDYSCSPVYKRLRTNLPKEIMNFSDFPFPKNLPSFVYHTDVKNYLHKYSLHHGLHNFIKFNTKVIQVKPQINENEKSWQVESINLLSNQKSISVFDIIIVCNGHFQQPKYPDDIKGIEKFHGQVIHSKHYKDPEAYKDKNVLVVGAGPSGVDISIEICMYAKKTWLSHRFSKVLSLPEKIEQIGVIKELIGKDAIINPITECSNALSFYYNEKSNEKAEINIVHEIDVIVLCTGYFYNFSFLDSSCEASITSSGVSPLYKDIICVSQQTLAFIGLQNSILPFKLFEHQAKFLLAFYQEKINTPKNEIGFIEVIHEDDNVKENCNGCKGPPHFCGAYLKTYMNDLAELANFEKVPDSVINLHKEVGLRRKRDFDYKDIQYEMGPDGFYIESRRLPTEH